VAGVFYGWVVLTLPDLKSIKVEYEDALSDKSAIRASYDYGTAGKADKRGTEKKSAMNSLETVARRLRLGIQAIPTSGRREAQGGRTSS
jgi:hypothetical protein